MSVSAGSVVRSPALLLFKRPLGRERARALDARQAREKKKILRRDPPSAPHSLPPTFLLPPGRALLVSRLKNVSNFTCASVFLHKRPLALGTDMHCMRRVVEKRRRAPWRLPSTAVPRAINPRLP